MDKQMLVLKPIQQERSNKRGQINTLSASMIALTVAIIIFVLGLVMVQKLRDTQTVGTEAYTAANKSLVGFDDFADFVPLIVLAVAAAVIIGIILASFSFGGGGRRGR